MGYQLTIDGQVYVFESKTEYNTVKQMDEAEARAYVLENTDEDTLCLLDDTDDDSDTTTNSNSQTVTTDDSIELSYLEQIENLECQRNEIYNNMSKVQGDDSASQISELIDEAREIQTEITSLRNEYLTYLETGEAGTSLSDSYSSSSSAAGSSGSDIVAGAEQYLGANNPSRKAGENPFVRIERGGSCDDFTTYVIDHSVSEDNLADWYTSLSENQKAWGPDIFRAAKKAGATVSASQAKAGDIAIVNLNGHGGGDHTVIVKEVKNGVLYAIDSNGGKVKNRTYDLDDVCTIARVTKS